jgi:hypothetical protein
MEKSTCASHSVMLNDYWQKGMKGMSSVEEKRMAVEVMDATGLHYKQIKVNYYT